MKQRRFVIINAVRNLEDEYHAWFLSVVRAKDVDEAKTIYEKQRPETICLCVFYPLQFLAWAIKNFFCALFTRPINDKTTW